MHQQEIYKELQKEYEAALEARKDIGRVKMIKGDLTTVAFNPLRDTIFMGNQSINIVTDIDSFSKFKSKI